MRFSLLLLATNGQQGRGGTESLPSCRDTAAAQPILLWCLVQEKCVLPQSVVSMFLLPRFHSLLFGINSIAVTRMKASGGLWSDGRRRLSCQIFRCRGRSIRGSRLLETTSVTRCASAGNHREVADSVTMSACAGNHRKSGRIGYDIRSCWTPQRHGIIVYEVRVCGNARLVVAGSVFKLVHACLVYYLAP